nr:hypothetical protein [Tanacetum cinerariifolium]
MQEPLGGMNAIQDVGALGFLHRLLEIPNEDERLGYATDVTVKLRALEEEKNLHYSNVDGNVNLTTKANLIRFGGHPSVGKVSRLFPSRR